MTYPFSTCLNPETCVSFSLVPASTQPSWSSSAKGEQYTASNGSTKSSKGGGGKNSKSSKSLRGKGSKSSVSLTVDDPAWDAPAPKPAPDVWSGGARRLGGGKNSADRTLVWGAAPEAKEWTAAPVESVKSWSSPETKKKVWAAAPAWPSPSGWKMSMAPSICAPTRVPTPVPTPAPTQAPMPAPTTSRAPTTLPAPTQAFVETVTFAPTTCLDRKWYFSDGICTNGNDEDGSYSNLQSCCEEAQPGEECEFKDVCCMMRKWYFADGKCTNGFAPEGDLFSSLVECCEAEQTNEKICTFDDVCVPEGAPTWVPTPVPTPAPTPAQAPTETVTFAPTTCLDRKWYFSDGICTNGNDEDGSYSNLQSCCEEAQPGEECEFKDVCCMMRKWYFADGKCTNGFAPEGDLFSSLVECCEAEQTNEKICTFDDVCVPEETTTPAPSVIFTPQPSTDTPTFGSTPTVSKEVTGPPTIPRRV